MDWSGWTGWIVALVLMAVILVPLAIGFFKVLKKDRLLRAPAFKGAPVQGTGQVLSVKWAGDRDSDIYERERELSQIWCQIALCVQLPGRAPYDATIGQRVKLVAMPYLQQPGTTVVVAADSENLQNVRIDFTQPIRPAAPPASTSGATSALVLPSQVRVGDSVRTGPQKPWMKVSNIEQYNALGFDAASYVFHGTYGRKIHVNGYLRIDCLTGDISAAELRASGQRVRGVLKSFRTTGETPRSRGISGGRPELLDAPYYALEVELRLPNLAAVVGRIRQPVPLTEVANLAIGRELNCAVDPADPANRWVVDWS